MLSKLKTSVVIPTVVSIVEVMGMAHKGVPTPISIKVAIPTVIPFTMPFVFLITGFPFPRFIWFPPV